MLRLIDYDRHVFEAYERGIHRLGWSEAVKNHEIAHLSYKDTLVHILNVHESLLMAVAQGQKEVWKDPSRKRENIRSWKDLQNYRKRVWKGIDDLVASLSDKKLKSIQKIPWFSGSHTLEDVIFQASFEQVHHLGEIQAVYWQLEKTPPQMMYIPTMLGLRASVR